MDISEFKHKIIVTVRFNEVDMLGVCNNAVYINYFEEARLQYIKELRLTPGKGLFSDGKLFFVVRNEINYLNFAKYDNELTIFTKISFIKNSSFGFEHLVVNLKTDKIIAEGKGIIVQVDSKTKKSTPLPQEFYNKVINYESDVEILKDKL